MREPTSTKADERTTREPPAELLNEDLSHEYQAMHRDRARQCEALSELAMAEHIRQILMNEQDHQIDLATALGENRPNLSG